MGRLPTLSVFMHSRNTGIAFASIIILTVCNVASIYGSPRDVEFAQSARNVDTYDFVEITLNVKSPDTENPFVDAAVEGWFAADDGRKINVDGFCDSPGGEDDPKQICGLRNDNGNLAIIYFPAGGSVTVKKGTLVPDLKARWYNPRTGRWTPAKAMKGETFSAPDEEDWTLLFQKIN